MVLISSSLLFCTLLSPATNSTSPIVTKMSQSVPTVHPRNPHCGPLQPRHQRRPASKVASNVLLKLARSWQKIQSIQSALPPKVTRTTKGWKLHSFQLCACLLNFVLYQCLQILRLQMKRNKGCSTERCCALFRVPTPRPPVLQGNIHNFTTCYMANFTTSNLAGANVPCKTLKGRGKITFGQACLTEIQASFVL